MTGVQTCALPIYLLTLLCPLHTSYLCEIISVLCISSSSLENDVCLRNVGTLIVMTSVVPYQLHCPSLRTCQPCNLAIQDISVIYTKVSTFNQYKSSTNCIVGLSGNGAMPNWSMYQSNLFCFKVSPP